MTARTTCSSLIDILRGMTDAGTADWTLGSAHYWDGDHIQAVLDRHRLQVRQELLASLETWVNGTACFYDYQSEFNNFEETNGGTAIFYIEDGTGADVGTASYTVDYPNGRITFGSDTTGSAYYLTGWSYDLNAAAADIWKQKAAHYASAYNFSTDNQSFSRGQLIANAVQMANYYSSQQKPITTVMIRSDVNADVDRE